MKTIVLVLVCSLYSILAFASENPYIELSDPSNLMEVHVNSSKYNPLAGTIIKREVSFGDGTVVLDKTDIYHQYSSAGTYNIVVKIWTSSTSVQTFSKTIEVNPQFRIFPISNSTVFADSATSGKKYSVQLSSTEAQRLYKIRLTKIPSTIDPKKCKFPWAIKINSMEIFQDGEIDCNTTSIEKLVRLKTLNEIVYHELLVHKNKKIFSTEISAVELVKDYSAPLITSDLSSDALTKKNKIHISVADESNVISYVWNQYQNLIFSTNQKNFDVPLLEGLNNFVIQSKDQYNNTSSYLYLTNVIRDSISASLNTVLNAEYIYSTYPQDFTLTIYSDEDLQSLTINDGLAFLTAPKTYTYVVSVTQPGQVDINLRAFDLAGNETIKTYSPLFNIDNIAPTISTNLASNIVTSQNSVHIAIVDNAATTTEVYKNGVLIKSTDLKEFDIVFEQQGFGVYVIKSRDSYNNEAEDIHFNVTFDNTPPQVASMSPEQGTIFTTHELPFTIPVVVEFSEQVTSVIVNSTSATMTTSTQATAQIQVNEAGPVVVHIDATDAAGNLVSIERTVNVEFSNEPPRLTLDPSVRNMLTYRTEIPVFGTSNVKLAAATLNGEPISISEDGLSFNGMFYPPQDGRYRIEIVAIDIHGNSINVEGYIRTLVDLPHVFENYAPLAAVPTTTGYRVDYGPGFSGSDMESVCGALDQMFFTHDEFVQDIVQLQYQEDAFLDKFPDKYTSSIPTTDSLMEFIGDIDEPLNYVKAGWGAVCHGKNIMPDSDCPKNREILKFLTGQYPEPMIIKSIPGIAPFIQDFLISRYNICTGLDTSGLTCEDMKRILPLVANLTFPSVGQMMSSPIGKLVMDELMCKQMCELPQFKETPVCKELPIPEIPQLDAPTLISLTPPNANFPDVSIGDGDWGGGGGGHGGHGGSGGHGGGGGGGSCGGWFSDCDDGGDGIFSCSAFPEIFFCSSGIPELSGVATVDSDVQCPTENWTLSDALNAASPLNYFISVMSKCNNTSVAGVPNLSAPVITVTSPTQNQETSGVVNVVGFVNDAHALVKVNGIDVKIIAGEQGAHFSAEISPPINNIVTVEAVNEWGKQAIPVKITIASSNLGGYASMLSLGWRSISVVENGVLKCKGVNFSGVCIGTGQDPVDDFTSPIGMDSGVVSMIARGGNNTLAIKDGELYGWGTFNSGIVGVWHPDGQTNFPVKIDIGPGNITKIDTSFHACAIKEGALYCWGNAYFGDYDSYEDYQDYEIPMSVTPTLVPEMNEGVTDVATGVYDTCAVKYGRVYCWGQYNSPFIGPHQFVAIQGMESGVTDIFVGATHACGVKNSELYCWGINNKGQLGIGTTVSSIYIAQKVPGLSGPVRQIEGDWWGNKMCALIGDGVECWIGNEPKTFRFSYSGAEQLIMGEDGRACVLSSDGTYVCPNTCLASDGGNYPCRD